MRSAEIAARQDDISLMEASPPWGAFPAEQYLIRHWDSTSSATRPDQTRELIRAFLQLADIPEVWDTTGRHGGNISAMERIPTVEEVRDILAPWRPLRWRRAALTIWKDYDDEPIWLRTHYANGDDRFAEWRSIYEDYDPDFEEDSVYWTVLDDPGTFDFGEHWERVFDVLPELTGPQLGYSRAFTSTALGDDFLSIRQSLKRAVTQAVDKEAQAEIGDGMRLQGMAVQRYLIVADPESFDSQKLRILYLDAKGNIVRHSRIEVEDIFYTRAQWIAARFSDSGGWWLEEHYGGSPGGILSEKYKARGEIGRILYDIDDLL